MGDLPRFFFTNKDVTVEEKEGSGEKLADESVPPKGSGATIASSKPHGGSGALIAGKSAPEGGVSILFDNVTGSVAICRCWFCY